MRTKLLGLMVGCGLAVATLVPAFACPFHAQEASDQRPQHTAQAQSSSDVKDQ